jgi:hypothetical protein
MDYQFERQICNGCQKAQFCIRKELEWLCQDCFSWAVDYAEHKDMINEIMVQQGIEDLDLIDTSELRNDRD